MPHPLNHDPYAKPSSEQEQGTRHPSRFEPKQSTVSSTQPQQRIRARVHGSAATQSIPNNAATTLVFDTVDFDTAGLLVANGFKIPSTGKVTGTWLFHAHVTWAAAASGLRLADLLANGSTIARDLIDAGGSDESSIDVQILVNDPTPGTSYTVAVTQTSGGGALNVDKDSTRTYFEVIHLW